MSDYQDYLIILSPPESICKSIKKLKDFSAGVVGDYDSRYSTAHITIQLWPGKRPVWIEPLLPKLERELQSLPPLVAEINRFDFFNHKDTHTIYAGLNLNAQTNIWFKHLRKFFNKAKFEPHITIARSIPHADFIKLWPHFKGKQWNEQFKIDKLTVLKRETISYSSKYKVFKEIRFNRRLDFDTFTNSKLKAQSFPLIKADSRQISLS